MASTGAAALGNPLPSPPSDGITRVRFSNYSDTLVASSWDQSVRWYEASKSQLRGTCSLRSPVLDCCLEYEANVYAGCLDGNVKRVDIATGREFAVGEHKAGVKCVEFLTDRGAVVTGSWDASLKVWDARAAPYSSCTATCSLPGKAYTLALAPDRLVVGCSGRAVWVYDLRRLSSGQAEQHRESSLKYQTRCVGAYPDGRGYALGSVEGRVAMEFFDMSPEAQASKYAFKCHRVQEGGREVTYPVSAIAFHPVLGTFATGGGDGVVNFWDGANKKRLHQISRYPTSVASLSFNSEGSLLAVASSYLYEFGEKDHPADEIFVHRVAESEVKPKPRQK